MSGIAGLVWKNGRHAQPGDLERMSARLAHRGTDAAGQYLLGSTGLIHRAHWTTTAADSEHQPLALQRGGPVISADARLDEKPALIESLGLKLCEDKVADAALILRAYERWGTDCASRLRGDFAFAIWDPARERLFCARDVFGVRPFYYHDGDELFAFASEIKGLHCLPQVPRDLDEVQLGFHLEQVSLDQQRSFFKNVRHLPPGTWLSLRGKSARTSRYYSLLDVAPLPRASDEEYIEEFRRCFDRAVRSRQTSPRAVGSMLSGGLDSSSIVCTARRQRRADSIEPLTTFSHVFDEVPKSDERPFIEAVVEGGDLVSRLLHGDRLNPLDDWNTVLDELDEPPYGANLYLNRALFRAAELEGVHVMLDGIDGDTVVGYGMERLLELACRLQLRGLWKESRAFAKVFDISRRKVLSKYVWRPGLRGVKQRAPTTLKALWHMARGRPWRLQGSSAPLSPLINKDFARRIDLAARIFELRRSHGEEIAAAGGRDASGMTQGHHSVVLEILDKAAAFRGVEPRYPYFDQSLVEFCLGLPARMRLQGGMTRYIQRAAVPEMPPLVRWRSWKGDLSHNFERAFRRSQSNQLSFFLQDAPSSLTQSLDLLQLDRLRARYASFPDAEAAFTIGKVLSLCIWLERAELLDTRDEN